MNAQLSLLLASCGLAALFMALLPKLKAETVHRIGCGVSVLIFLFSLMLLLPLKQWNGQGLLVSEQYAWIPTLGIDYFVGVDGISLFLVLLTTFLMPIVALGSFTYITERVRSYYTVLFLLELTMLGAFVALDLFLFYVFWEAMLIPMFVLIGVWGGERRIYATIKFFLYTLAGSFLMLVAVLWLYYYMFTETGVLSTNLHRLLELDIPLAAQLWLFLAFAFSFAIKVPMFPFHTWLPDAHVEAPTGGSVILAGVLLKMGTYGFIRFAIPLFPEAARYFALPIMILAVIGIIYGALVAWVQTDAKKLVAYSSISHLGFVILGLFSLNAEGMGGAVYQMVAHGVASGGLFLIVGMLYERRHTRALNQFGGIATRMPAFAVLSMVIILSSVGLPGLNGFVGEFLILLGTFVSPYAWGPQIAIAAAIGVVVAAVYLLHFAQSILFGPLHLEPNRFLKDLSPREAVVLASLGLVSIAMGMSPNLLLQWINPSTVELLQSIGIEL